MKKILGVLGLVSLLALGACNNEDVQLIKQSGVVIIPDRNSIDHCVLVKKFPDYKTLTDSQVAKLLVLLQHQNVLCKHTVDDIYDYLNQAKAKIESK
jgi:lipoprotein NlpI